jgi:hypothetical protein
MQYPGSIAAAERLLRDKFFRKMVVEIGDEHRVKL